MRPRFSDTVVRTYVAHGSPSYEIGAMPVNLMVSEVYRPIVEMMRLRSATFRRQCARIAATPRLLVIIESEPPRLVSSPAALTRIKTYELGRVRAVVRIPVSGPVPELIAHELEHVLEQLDGVDLRVKASLPSSGVHWCDCGGLAAFETARAVSAGRRVALESRADEGWK